MVAFQQAAALLDQGRVREAEQLYEAVLAADEHHFETLFRLGVIRLQRGEFEAAEALFRRATKVDRKSADAHHYLGFALTGLKRFDAAARAYEKALSIRPAFPEVHNNFGHALQVAGRIEQAITRYKKAIALNPDYAEAYNNLGNALHLLDRSEEALAHYERALAIRPDYAEAYWNLANSLRAVGRFDQAIAAYGKALASRPNYVEAHNGLGNTFQILGRYDEAIREYEKALALNPAYADALINLGDAFAALKEYEKALIQFDAALAAHPDNDNVHVRRGSAFAKLRRHDAATDAFEKALSIDPKNTLAFNGALISAGAACDWPRTARLADGIAVRAARGEPIDPFTLLGHCSDPALHLTAAAAHARDQSPIGTPALWQGGTWRNEKIRLAYVSADFHQHPTAYLTAELLEIHDRSRFEVVGVSMGPDDGSEIRARIVKAFDRFYDIRSQTDDEAAARINAMQVDVAIDCTGYTANARSGIFARHPAPIQLNYLAFPGSLGADCYDYVIADPTVLPMDQQRFYTEKIVHLPHCYQVSDAKRVIAAETPTRPQAALPEAGFVFCCFNQNYKITKQIFDIWMRLLGRIEGSVLWLLRNNRFAEENLCREAAARGIDPMRVIFADRVKIEAHLARHRLADLFLDTLPYNAHTTASDALWAGLPLVTCQGACFAGRVAASLLQAIGLPELVTHNLVDYEALALRLALEPSFLRTVRERLQRNRLVCPLFDSQRYRRHIEAAYTTMWEIWQRGERSRSFAVEARS
jgi:predicted O-linked N-acetylglucosamine transferase (SPINDLY family)